ANHHVERKGGDVRILMNLVLRVETDGHVQHVNGGPSIDVLLSRGGASIMVETLDERFNESETLRLVLRLQIANISLFVVARWAPPSDARHHHVFNIGIVVKIGQAKLFHPERIVGSGSLCTVGIILSGKRNILDYAVEDVA